MQKKDSKMSLQDAEIAEWLEKLLITAEEKESCMMQYVLIAAKKPRFHLTQPMTDLFIAENALKLEETKNK